MKLNYKLISSLFAITAFCIILFLIIRGRFFSSRDQGISSRIAIPEELHFGAGTSAFQIEGAMNTNGRGESYVEKYYLSASSGNGRKLEPPEIACDSYHQYKQDVQVAKDIGLKFYRFSISWSRILPKGFADHVNQEGLEYYSALLDELEKAGIEPMIQLVHFDHPAIFEEFGGWQSESMVELFKDYASVVFEKFAHRAKYFLTFNEPNIFCNYFDSLVTNQGVLNSTFPRNYKCSHNILKAHAEVYHHYHNEYNSNKTGMISINLSCNDFIARHKNDEESADVGFAFNCGWFANPIFSQSGDYPDILKRRVDETIQLQGYNKSDMPTFSDYWIKRIQGTADFFSFSYYSARLVEPAPADDPRTWQNFFIPPESRLLLTHSGAWSPTPNSNFIFAKGLRTVLKAIKQKYNNPPVFIMENGYSDNGQINDIGRIKFIYAHVKETIDAINEDKCNVKGYIYWSLIDNYEFWDGYNSHFGLARVDFENPNRTRTLRTSAEWLRSVIAEKHLFLYD